MDGWMDGWTDGDQKCPSIFFILKYVNKQNPFFKRGTFLKVVTLGQLSMWSLRKGGIEVYKGRTYAENTAIVSKQVRKKVPYKMARGEHLTIGETIILAEILWFLL